MFLILASLPLLAVLAAAPKPAALAGVSGGLWEVSRSATGANPIRQCVADPVQLAQWEHRGDSCTRVIIVDARDEAVIHYTCTGRGFGRTRMTVLTPRSLRLQTQGIANKYPFNYVLQARRVGDCRPH